MCIRDRYYYSASGKTSWEVPKAPAVPPPPPPKAKTHEQKLNDIINGITQQESSINTPKDKTSSNGTPQSKPIATAQPIKSDKKEKWRAYSEDKRMKIYENTASLSCTDIDDRSS